MPAGNAIQEGGIDNSISNNPLGLPILSPTSAGDDDIYHEAVFTLPQLSYDPSVPTQFRNAFMMTLGNPDTQSDAETRAPKINNINELNSASQTSLRGTPNQGAQWTIRKVTVHFRVDVCCPGDWLLTAKYKHRPIGGSNSSWTDDGAQTIGLRIVDNSSEQSFDLPLEPDFEVALVDAFLRPPLGCPVCSGVIGVAGFGASPEHGCINWYVPLGTAANGQSAGGLQLLAQQITAGVYTPSLLAPYLSQSFTTLITDSTGAVRQVVAPQALVDVVPTAAQAYEIRFYDPSQSGTIGGNGLYQPTGTPYLVWRVENPDANATNRLRITKIEGSQTVVTLIDESQSGVQVISEANGLRVTTTTTTTENGDRAERSVVQDAANNTSSVRKVVYHTFPWGDEKVKEVLDPDGAALTTQWTYQTDSTSKSYERVLTVTHPDGSQEVNNYYAPNGWLINTTAPGWITSTVSTDISRQLLDLNGDGVTDILTRTARSVGPTLLGIEYLAEYGAPLVVGNDSYLLRDHYVYQGGLDQWNNASNLVTHERLYQGGAFSGELAYRLTPDLVLTTRHFTANADGTTTLVEDKGAPDASHGYVVDGTRVTQQFSARGYALSTITTDIATGSTIDQLTVTATDSFGRATHLLHIDGFEEVRTYCTCGQLESVSYRGETTTYDFDDLNRRISETHSAGTTILSRTNFVYDADGRLLQTIRVDPSSNAQTVLASTGYDLAGRVTSQTSLQQGTTVMSYAFGSGNSTVTSTTYADGGTRIETRAPGGEQVSVRGSAVAPVDFAFFARNGDGSGDGYLHQTKRYNDDGTTPIDTDSVDLVGRVESTTFAGGAQVHHYFDSAGRPVRDTDADGVATLYAYDSQGRRSVTAIDVDGNGTIDYAGNDRITRVVYDVGTHGGTTVQRTTTQVWPTGGQDAPTTVSVTESGIDGLNSWQTVDGLTTSTSVAYDGQGGHTVTTTGPDGTTTVQGYLGDRFLSTAVSQPSVGTLGSVTRGYDSVGRLQTETDARTGTTTYAYDANDRLASVTSSDPDPNRSGPGYDPQTTAYTYDVMGRVATVTQPDGGVVTTTYTVMGQVQRTSGARTYPVQYGYDGQGRVKTLTTWKDYAGNNGQAVTTWNYDDNRGWLTGKVYADGRGPTYAYTSGGRLSTRTWARGIVTAYHYNSAGDVASVTYSDSTPSVTLTYDRLGRVLTRTDAAGACTYAYQGTTSLVTSESCSGGLLGGLGLTRGFDALNRLSSVSSLSALPTTNYGYDAASRLQIVTSGADTATYAYLPNSPLVQSVAFTHSGAARLTTARTYDNLNRLVSITSTPSAATAVTQAYTYNSANERTQLTREDGSHWDYGYDALGQVTAGTKKLASGDMINGYDYGYSYDDIGNRQGTTVNGRSASYTSNALNEYVQRDVPRAADVIGSADPGATVTVNNGSVSRQGARFYQSVTVSGNAAAFPVITVAGSGPNAGNVTAPDTRNAFVAATPEAYAPDLDGNTLADGRWNYTWDAENRLIAMETPAALAAPVGPLPNVERRRLDFAYDGLGRRVRKVVSAWNYALGTWTPVGDRRFLYDGWNLVAEFDPNLSTKLRGYAWGLDMSGSLQGAGGVGGLLIVSSANLSGYACPDGNGNVTSLVDGASGQLSAEYEYGPFGEAIEKFDLMGLANPFQFSSKYTDGEGGLVYYGQRYYNPSTGRWLARDPMEEDGGANLYGFVGNEPTDQFDPLGLEDAQADFVSKSFINGIPTIGSFKGAVATRRLQLFAQAVGKSDAFNQNPASDAKDGKYRLYTRVTIKASCCENAAPTVTIISTDKDGGSEGPLSGTINLSKPDLITSGSTVNVHWKGWGRPNMTAPELGMQMVKTRTSRNIWHDVTIIVSCKDGKPSFQEGALKVSKFPSFRLWKDGKAIDERRQGALSDLWQADPSDSSFVAP